MTNLTPPASLPASPSRLSAILRRLFPRSERLIQWAAYAIVFSVLVLHVLSNPPGTDRSHFIGPIICLAALLLLNIFWDQIYHRFSNWELGELILLVISALLAWLATWLGLSYTSLYLVLMISAQATIILKDFVHGLIFTLVLAGVFLAILGFMGLPPDGVLSVSMSVLAGLVFVVTLSRVLSLYNAQTVRLEKALAELQQANTALIEARQKEQELAVEQERVRMAREIHDGLGHHLTALSIQLQAAGKLAASHPEQAAASIALCREEAQAALREVRQSVAALRQNPAPVGDIRAAISGLASDFERSTGLPASLKVTGEPGRISPAAAQTLYRAVQEGLTNSRKHAAGATRVLIDLCWLPGEARLVIQDDGQPGEAGYGEAGFGLAGIYERVQLLHGTASSGPLEEGGFRIQLSIPTGGGQ